MGTKLTIERRYTAKERSLAGDNELKECNTKVELLELLLPISVFLWKESSSPDLQAGLRIFGLQAEIDKVCQSKEPALL